ncbi:hypothetical protein SAMN05518854_1182 [Variovorax sp. YR266]|nr:hypothetical protein SAMN05518854_1182 [Variovorax sp. YR266]
MPERQDISVLVLVFLGRRSLNNPLLVRSRTSGLESGLKVGEFNYRRIDFQDMAETSESKAFQLSTYSVQKLPSVIVLVM